MSNLLKFAWNKRKKLRAEGDKLMAEGNKLMAESNKIRAEGDKLRAEGDKLWAEAVLIKHGNVEVKWLSINSCVVEGVTYE